MRFFANRRLRLALAIPIMAVALGCAGPAIPIVLEMVVATAVVVTAVAVAVNEVQKVEAAHLDLQERRLRIEGLQQDGQKITVDRLLSHEQIQQIKTEKKLKVNDTVLTFRPE